MTNQDIVKPMMLILNFQERGNVTDEHGIFSNSTSRCTNCINSCRACRIFGGSLSSLDFINEIIIDFLKA